MSITITKHRDSPKLAATLEAIRAHIAEHGYAPTGAELAKALGITRGATLYRLRLLADNGYITRSEGKPRALAVTDKGRRA